MAEKRLFIDTAINTCQILYVSSGQVLFDYRSPISQEGHGALFFEQIRLLQQKFPEVFQTLDSLIVNIGPGRFNALRVGVAFALSTASLYSIQLYTVTSFDIANLSFKDRINKKEIIIGTIYAKWNHVYFHPIGSKDYLLKTFSEMNWPQAYGVAFPGDPPSAEHKHCLALSNLEDLLPAALLVEDAALIEPIYLGHQIHQ